MANLAGTNLDPNVKENHGDFEVLPPNNYKMVIIGDELKDNKAKTGKILMLKLQTTEGQHAGTMVNDFINLTNPSPVCQNIGQGTLKRICGLCSVVYPPTDTTVLYGKPMSVKIGVSEFKSNNTGDILKSNKVISYNAAEKGQAVAANQSDAIW